MIYARHINFKDGVFTCRICGKTIVEITIEGQLWGSNQKDIQTFLEEHAKCEALAGEKEPK